MQFEKIDCGNGIAVSISSDNMIITDVDSALDLLMSAKYEAGTKYIIINKKNIIEAVSYTHLDVYKRQACPPARTALQSCPPRKTRCN